MNIKEQFTAYLKQNATDFEEINERILFNYKGRNIIMKERGTLKSQFELLMPFLTQDQGKLINSDKGLIKMYLEGDNKITAINFTETVKTDKDYSFSEDNTKNALDALLKKEIDTDYETMLKNTGEFLLTILDAGKELGKTSLSAGADVLRSLADLIDSKQNNDK